MPNPLRTETEAPAADAAGAVVKFFIFCKLGIDFFGLCAIISFVPREMRV